MSAGMDEQDLRIASSFRKHRHDVLNLLQLMRAYIQVERYSDAIRAIDTCAIWLQSLTMWQTRCTGLASELIWTAANCPHVILTDMDADLLWNADIVSEIEQLLDEIEQCAAQLGWSSIYLAIRQQRNQVVESRTTVFCELPLDLSHDEFKKAVISVTNSAHLEVELLDGRKY